MSQKIIDARIQLRRDTAANWEAKDEVLLDGEKVVVTTAAGQTRFKVGDGVKTFKQLPYTDEVLNEAISQKAEKSKSYTTSLGTTWTGTAAPYTQTITLADVTTSNIIEIKPTSAASDEQRKAYQALQLSDGGQAAGSFTLKAAGTKNTVAIPIQIIVRGDL